MNLLTPKYGFDVAFSKQMVQASMDAYLSEEDMHSVCERWDCEDIEFIACPATDTECIAIYGADQLILAFRGTSSKKDLFTDFTAVKSRYLGTTVHKGFRDAWLSIEDKVLSYVDKVKPQKVRVAGHSLGGALATHAALSVSLWRFSDCQFEMDRPSLYTYGSPRVGDKAFSDLVNSTVFDHYRVTNGRDIIPRVPIFFRTNILLPESLPLIPTGETLKHCGAHIPLKSKSSRFFELRHKLDHYMEAHEG